MDTPGPDIDLSVAGLSASYDGAPAVRDFNIEVRRSEFVTLLGPSGCGKTTTLRCVAGLHMPDAGTLRLGGECIHSDALHVPAHRRDINMVFQSYAVWPHMTTFDNVAYGLRAKKLPPARVRARAREMLELVGLAAFESRYATELSGGQQQRVALARALATQPRLVLMDEPLSNLDARLRARMRNEIREIQRKTGSTVLYVTHDQAEALSMSDRIVVMREGEIQQVADARTLYNRPANEFVATFVGEANILPAIVIATAAGSFAARVEALEASPFTIALDAAARGPRVGDAVSLVFRPEWVRLGEAAAQNGLDARLASMEFLGDHFECRYVAGPYELRVHALSVPSLRPPLSGARSALAVDPANLAWFPRGRS